MVTAFQNNHVQPSSGINFQIHFEDISSLIIPLLLSSGKLFSKDGIYRFVSHFFILIFMMCTNYLVIFSVLIISKAKLELN